MKKYSTNICEQSASFQRKWWTCSWLSLHLSRFFRSRWFWTSRVLFTLSCPPLQRPKGVRNTSSEISTKFDWSIAKSHRMKGREIGTCFQLRELLYTDSQDMLVLSSTLVSRQNNCCTDGSPSIGNCGCRNLVRLQKF
jgi:hypothetical protein